MKRRDFLRRFGIGVAAAAAAPAVVKEAIAQPSPEPTEVYHGPAYEKKFNPEYFKEVKPYFDANSKFSKAQMEADFMLQQAMDRELFLGSGHVTGQSLKCIFQ